MNSSEDLFKEDEQDQCGDDDEDDEDTDNEFDIGAMFAVRNARLLEDPGPPSDDDSDFVDDTGIGSPTRSPTPAAQPSIT